MRVNPSNQTLILAGERAPPRSNDATGSNAVLQRVTMLAARPDDTLVYFRADYSSGHAFAYTNTAESVATETSAAPDKTAAASASPESGTSPSASAVVPWVTSRSIHPSSSLASSSRDVYGNARTSNRGVEQYAVHKEFSPIRTIPTTSTFSPSPMC